MKDIWKPDAAQKRAMKSYLARVERISPRAMILEIGERRSDTGAISTNLLSFDTDYAKAVEMSDMHQPLPWDQLQRGIPLVGGKAVVDLYVYERAFGDHGDLLTNLTVFAETIQGKTHITKMQSTGAKAVSGEALWAFHQTAEAQKEIGTTAHREIALWAERR